MPMNAIPHALYRAAQVRELDRIAIEELGIAGYTLMTRAGTTAFHYLRRRWPAVRRLAVVCGPGNNGGDGYVVARLAHEAGLSVGVLQLGDHDSLRGDARRAAGDWHDGGGVSRAFEAAALHEAELVVDAVFGTGLERQIGGPWREAIEAINALAAPVLALDLPSGLHADSGAMLGVAVAAVATVTFIGLKQGMFTGRGPDLCGEIAFDDLGVPDEALLHVPPAASRIEHDLLARLLPQRARTSHKGDFGHVLVVGGGRGMAGAARMAAEAAGRVGAGLVSVATRPEHAVSMAAARPELMCHGVESGRELRRLARRANVIAIGPGLGQSDWAAELLAAALDAALPLIVDADALNLLAFEPGARGNWILTPHPGEAARLLGSTAAQVQADRFAALGALVDAFSGVCVLKGAGSLVQAPGGLVYVCDAGNPGMASGGMGDVLTGVLAGLAAQGLDLEDAARAGTYLHACAADAAAAAGERGLRASDLLPELRRLVNPRAPGVGAQ